MKKRFALFVVYFRKTLQILSMLKKQIGGITMSQLSEKELSTLKDLLADEDLLVKKFKMLAEHAEDATLKAKMTEISNKHQGHFNELYSKLS